MKSSSARAWIESFSSAEMMQSLGAAASRPAPFVEVEDPTGLLRKVRVDRKSSGAVLPWTDRSSHGQRTIVDCDASQIPCSMTRR
jgi:hypothetical protein